MPSVWERCTLQVFEHTNARHVVLSVPTSERLREAIFCKEEDGHNETGSQTCSHGSRSQLQCSLFVVRCGVLCVVRSMLR